MWPGCFDPSVYTQVLAMSSSLASRGVSTAYRKISRYLRWSLMGIKGNLPVLDSAFSNNENSTNNNSAAWVANVNSNVHNSIQAQPPTRVTDQVSPHQPSSPAARRHLMLNDGEGLLQSPPPAPPQPQLQYTARDALLLWLKENMKQLYDSGNSSNGRNTSMSSGGGDKSMDDTSSSYVLVGGAANESISEAETTGSTIPVNRTSSEIPTEKEQELLFTLAVAGLLLVALVLVHCVIVLSFRFFIGGQLHPILQFPRVEVDIGGMCICV